MTKRFEKKTKVVDRFGSIYFFQDDVFISMDFAETSAVVPTKTLIPISYESSDQQIKSKGEIDKENVKSNSLEVKRRRREEIAIEITLYY